MLVFTGDSERRVALAVALLWVREVKPAGTVSPHRSTVNPAGQAPSELRVDTYSAGLVSSSLTSALEFLHKGSCTSSSCIRSRLHTVHIINKKLKEGTMQYFRRKLSFIF
ncbi:UNVERIFIED_CONTAM: hypothetical protein FKN15_070227 [Acipenser sinensis]